MQNTPNQIAAISRVEAMTPAQKEELLARWARYIEPDPFGGCWLWSGKQHAWGYGLFSIAVPGNDQFYIRAHRFSVYLQTGRLPASKEFVCHRCDVPACVNPAHLFIGSNRDNMRDCAQKGRARGGKGGAKVTPEIVRLIRTSPLYPSQLQTVTGLKKRQITHIRAGRAWKEYL